MIQTDKSPYYNRTKLLHKQVPIRMNTLENKDNKICNMIIIIFLLFFTLLVFSVFISINQNISNNSSNITI